VVSSPFAPELTGAVLSRRFELGRKLGAGGMASVYEAKDLSTQATVAVKVLHTEFFQDSNVFSRFEEEGRATSKLVHPNVVRVHESAQAEDGRPYLVMELLSGVPLGSYTRNGNRVPVAQAVNILQGVLAGLAAAHAQGIVHRDLKPDNVFLARDEAGRFQAKVLDFGIAKVMDVAGGMGQKTATGLLLGTPAYMSPEQIQNARLVDVRSDLWSAGVIFYEMLTGRPAFPAPTEFARLAAVLNKEPAPLSQVDAELAPFEAFVLKALQKDREKRFSTAHEMARALAAHSPREEATATPLSRLPDVPSLLSPHVQVGAAAPSSAHPTPVPARAPDVSPIGPHGTLASPKPGALPGIGPGSKPDVVLVNLRGTLPSEDLPVLSPMGFGRARSGGVPTGVVVALVLVALAAGFFMGLGYARLR
jgi:eukaryotic-like serine/threonine-protein kinase